VRDGDLGGEETAIERASDGERGSQERGDQAGSNFPVVGIGASAGGLESLERLFQSLPPDTGMAFVVLQHLSPDFKSLMDELLSRRTSMRVRQAAHDLPLEPDVVYLLPPMKEMIVRQRRLLLNDKDPRYGLTLPIDLFFRAGPGCR
jgi:two-component system CheB/CheR fusion protein